MKKKRLLMLVLVFICAMALVACGKSDSGSGDGDGKSGKSESGKDGNKDNDKDDDEDKSGSKKTAESIIGKREGWSFHRGGGDAHGIWDTEVLPDWFPAPVEGVDLTDWGTYYKGVDDDDLMGSNEVGNIRYENDDFEEYSLSFYCTKDQFEEFMTRMQAVGLVGGRTGDNGNERPYYEYIGKGYYVFVWVNANAVGQENMTHLVDVSMTPTLKPLPKTFKGISLPSFGVDQTYPDEAFGYIEAYDADYNDVTDSVEWDFDKDKGTLDASMWRCQFRYGVVSEQQCRDYMEELKSKGAAIFKQSEEGVSFYFQARINDLIVFVTFEDYDTSATVQIVNSPEMIY